MVSWVYIISLMDEINNALERMKEEVTYRREKFVVSQAQYIKYKAERILAELEMWGEEETSLTGLE